MALSPEVEAVAKAAVEVEVEVVQHAEIVAEVSGLAEQVVPLSPRTSGC